MMRLDKYLKVSRIIKRRTVANEVCDAGKAVVNGKVARASYDVKVGDVVELLAYYTAPVKTAYYEDLLGSKLAEAPDDAEMLDIIWDSQAGDVGLIVSNLDGLGNLVCMVPNMCINGNTNEYASYLRSNKNVANKNLEKLFSPKYS